MASVLVTLLLEEENRSVTRAANRHNPQGWVHSITALIPYREW